ncbi:hypothetical protein [Sporosarcina sp. G11-34]|uniref:hypothetical protein n=1 Tax=Sporosarcina sp. G11-34 TaxID=2849605 RepID=UPI0022A99E33|nr:hypothetical protein [Sporosarcina sp. G11-34]MCZ2257552.1 hypothetical protein [Sporosarcina sp. G11-34]
MYKNLSPNLKISITRSITQTFEQYMTDIAWSEDKFRIEDFISSWQEYITSKALWYSEIPEEIKYNEEFHEELAVRINESIARILQDPPTEKQIAAIQMAQEELGTHYEYNCKAEATYVEGLLKNIKK